MTDKITIERETLERAADALLDLPLRADREVIAAALRAALAAQPATVDDHLKCGHHRSLAINSAETGEFLYCDLCDAKSRCRDAETMEEELRAALAAQPAIGVTCTMTDAPCTRNCGIACSLQMEALAAQSAEPVAWMDDFGNAFPLGAIKGAGSWRDEHQRNWRPLYTAPPAPAAVPPGHVVVPDYRGYANLGTGQYVLNISGADDPPELIISIASDEDKAGRTVGDLRDNQPGTVIQPEQMAVRLRFASEAGLAALEQQLRILRDERFAASQEKT